MRFYFRVICVLLFITNCVYTSFSQTSYSQLGLKAGFNISNVKTNIPSYSTKDIIGGNLSITYDRVHFRFLTVGGEFNWMQRGFTNSIIVTNAAGLSIGAANLRNKFNYFSVPLKIGVQLGGRLYIFGNAAIIPGYLLKAVTEIPIVDENGQITDYAWEDTASEVARFDLSTQIEVGIGVTKAERFKFYVSAAKQEALFNIFNNPQSSFDIKSTGIIFSTGLKIEFGKGFL